MILVILGQDNIKSVFNSVEEHIKDKSENWLALYLIEYIEYTLARSAQNRDA
jgi:hypothetical protein